nr:hypothetical protein [Tanacetum cinerariifolium]
MILESVENGPLLWPTVEENEVTRPKKYSELSATEAIQVDCDVKATNIILQGLLVEVYALKKEELLHDFYLRFSLLLNDMNIYNMKLEQFQVNTKFLNTLLPKWSKFVSDVKLVRDLHMKNVDQLHAYLGQHEYHANEELEAHYMYMAQLQEVSPEADDSGPIFDDEPLQKVSNDDHYNVFAMENRELLASLIEKLKCEIDESKNRNKFLETSNKVLIEKLKDADLAKERELLASLIAKLKCEIDKSKNRNTFLEASNKVLVEKLKSEIEDFKNKNKSLTEANNKLSKENDMLYADFKKSKAELKRRDSIEYASEMELACAKVRELTRRNSKEYATQMELECEKVREMKDKLSAHQETISILSKQKEAQIKLYKTQEDRELDKVINLEKESRSKLSDSIRPFDYDKLNNMYDLFVPQHEKSSKQCYFSKRSRLSHTNVNNGKSEESFHKQTTLLEKRMDESIQLDKQCQSSIEIFKVKTDVNTIINGVELCKQKISNRTYIGYIDPFIQNMIEQNFSPVISRINAGLDQFNRCLNEEMVADLRYFNSLELEVDSLKSQLETQKTQFVNAIDRLSKEYYYADHMNAILCVYTELDETKDFCKEREQYFEIQDLKAQLQDKGIIIITSQNLPPNKKSILKNMNVLAPGMYKIHTDHNQTRTSKLPQNSRKTNKCVSFSTGVNPTTSVSRPQLKSNPMGDRVMRNNSQGKKQEVEDLRRNVKLPKNKTSVTACNDNLNAKTLNVKVVSAMCDKCVLLDNHAMCVLNSMDTSIKKTVTSESNQKPRNFTWKLYERVSKTCSWWYSKFTPSGYKWKPKSGKENVNPNISMPIGNASRTANVMDTMTFRRSTVSNTPLSSNSFAARRDCPIHH